MLLLRNCSLWKAFNGAVDTTYYKCKHYRSSNNCCAAYLLMYLIWTDPFRCRNGLTQKDFFNPGLKFMQSPVKLWTVSVLLLQKWTFLAQNHFKDYSSYLIRGIHTKQGELPQGAIHKLRGPIFDLFWPPTYLLWTFVDIWCTTYLFVHVDIEKSPYPLAYPNLT